MAVRKRGRLRLMNLWRGQNSDDPPLSLEDNAAAEAFNVNFNDSTLGRKRSGISSLSQTGLTATTDIYYAARHTTGSGATDEMWIETRTGPTTFKLGRTTNVSSPSWTEPTLKDDIGTPTTFPLLGCSFNGKFFLCYPTSGNTRLHVWDGTTVRRVGLAVTGTPTLVESAGAVTDNRKYKVAVTIQAAGVTTYRSELSAFSAQATLVTERATVTIVSAPGEGETHWELYAYSDDDDYGQGFLVATTAIATTTAVDNNATLSGNAPPVTGTNALWPSVRYLLAADNQLIGAYDDTNAKYSRVYYAAVLGSSDVGDDERVPDTALLKNRVDLDEGNGGVITGMAGPLEGNVFVFKTGQIWQLTPTGDVTAPFLPLAISKSIGHIHTQHSIVLAEDETGAPAIYFLHTRGYYRLGQRGIEYLGNGIEGLVAAIDNVPSDNEFPVYGVWIRDLRQVVWLTYDGTARDCHVWDIQRSCWSRYQLAGGPDFIYKWLVVASETLTWIGGRNDDTGAGILGRFGNGTQDLSTNYQAYIKTKAYRPEQRPVIIEEPTLIAEASSGVTITLTIDRNFAAETRTATATLTAGGTETRIIKTIEAGTLADCDVVQFQLGDSAAANTSWTLDEFDVPYHLQEERS